MARPISSKRDFVERFRRGEFGNSTPTWDSVRDWFAERERYLDSNLYHLRNRIPGGRTHYSLEGWRLYTWAGSREGKWVYGPEWYVSMMAPMDQTAIQGELRRVAGGLQLHYTTVPLPMRDALTKDSRQAMGLVANMLLQRNMDAGSYDWIQTLLDEYPNHIVEFTTFKKPWGTLATMGFATVIWELRPDRGFSSNLSEFTQVY